MKRRSLTSLTKGPHSFALPLSTQLCCPYPTFTVDWSVGHSHIHFFCVIGVFERFLHHCFLPNSNVASYITALTYSHANRVEAYPALFLFTSLFFFITHLFFPLFLRTTFSILVIKAEVSKGSGREGKVEGSDKCRIGGGQ